MANSPAWQFYGGDWKKDPDLAKCDLATRGFWLELLDAMNQSATFQVSGTYKQLAKIARCEPKDARKCVRILQETGAADVQILNETVTVTCRRYQRQLTEREEERDKKRRQRHAQNGQFVPPLSPHASSSPSSSSSSSIQEGRKEGAASPPESPVSDFPETHAAVNQPPFAGTGPEVTAAIVKAAREVEPEITDAAIALIVRITHWPKQKSPWAWRKKVPEYLRSTPPEQRGKAGPTLVPARAAPSPPAPAHKTNAELRRMGEAMILAKYATAPDKAASGGD